MNNIVISVHSAQYIISHVIYIYKIYFTISNNVFNEKTLRTKVVDFEIFFQIGAISNVLFNIFPHHHLFDSLHNWPL